MSTVFIGHTGHRLTFDPSTISTLEALRNFVATHGIAPRNQILLTAQGKQVRTQTLLTEHELFVFDAGRLSSKAAGDDGDHDGDGQDEEPEEFKSGPPPDTIGNQNDLASWQTLFRARRNWAAELLNGCQTRAKLAERFQDEQGVIERSLGVAVASLQLHLKTGEQKYGAAQAWSEEVLQDFEQHTANWEANLDSLRNVPARVEFARFFQIGTSASTSSTNNTLRRLSQQGNGATLQNFVDVPGVRKAAAGVTSLTTSFARKMDKMRDDLEGSKRDVDELVHAVDQLAERSTTSNSSEPGQLLDEVILVVKKMASDLEHVQSLPQTPQSISQASKMALLHARNYLPNLGELCSEMNELVRRNSQQRHSAAQTALEHMRSLSSIESTLAELYQDVKTLEFPSDGSQATPILNVVARLPSVYGALLVEAVRRREWIDKMKHDCGTLQEEVAIYQDEEDKRRKKWVQSVEDVCKSDSLLSSVLGVELSLQNQGGSWPVVSRNELHDYLKNLADVYGQGEVTQEMDQAVKDLDKPTRKQIKHARAFKNGSMHEAFGETSLLLRGDDQHKTLREMNARLEEELKGQKSRVRRLEDLLHRQTHISRAAAGDMFTPQSASAHDRSFAAQPNLSPHGSDDASRTGLPKHRRLSSTTKDLEEKRLARRIVDLEAELLAARDEATAQKNSDVEVQKQFEEAVSTKKDLMENMEAQQREFATERRGLEKELREVKERVEELENELERLVGSRDDERTGLDARVGAFEEEIARLKEEAQAHAARSAAEQEAKSALERKLAMAENATATAEERVRVLEGEQEQRREAEAEQLQLLTTAHKQLSPDADAPTGFAELTASLDELARKSAGLVKDLMEAVAFAKSEKEALADTNEKQRDELAKATEKLTAVEAEMRQAQERLSSEEARVHSLEQNLDEEQNQLRILRSKFADGETGSEVLRQRVAEEEAKAGKLSSDLAEARSHINSLDVELMRLQRAQRTAQDDAKATTERLSKRGDYAKDVSQRLFAQHSRLNRLLERLGLAISYADGEMVVERASKLGQSTALPDSRDLLNRTVSLTSPPPTRKPSYNEEASDLSLLRWSEAATVDEESSQFEAYMQQISRFNIETFSDAVVKRLRDFEYTAKKYNKEAKESSKRAEAYKERSIRNKTESSAKIAVKDFKEGDLALFLPTRGQAKGAWAAFNINCPHYFLDEREGMRLVARDFIVCRIAKIEQKVVDLSKSSVPAAANANNDAVSEALSFADDNPFDLSDGLTWWLVHAVEERGGGLGGAAAASAPLGAPSTPGLAKSTVAHANVDAKGSIRIKRNSKGDDASKFLNKSLDSRRSSSASKRSVAGALVPALANTTTGGSSPSGNVNAAANNPTVAPFGESAVASPRLGGHARGDSLEESRLLPFAVVGSGNRSGSGGAAAEEAGNARDAILQTQQPTQSDTQHAAGAESSNTQQRTPQPQPASDEPANSSSRTRSLSPSKSIRSLQRHLDTRRPGSPLSKAVSPSKATPSPAKKQQQQQGWEPLWQAEFSVESPSKSGAGGSSGVNKKK